MARRILSPEALAAAVFTYLAALFEAFQHDPAKFQEIEKLLEDIRFQRDDLATNIASVMELLKGHWSLIIGLKHFLPAEADIPELTMDDSRAYIAAVKEAFKDEPGKYKEFVQIIAHVYNHKGGEAHCFARVRELMKDYQNLILGFSVLIPETAVTIPPVSNKATREFSFITKVKEAFYAEPARYTEFLRLLSDYRAHRVDVISLSTRVDELMKDHPNLLRDFVAFLLAQTEKTTHSDFVKKIKEVFQDGHASYKEFKKLLNGFRARSVKQKNPRAYDLVAKVKGDDIHVYKSFLQIVKKLREKNVYKHKVYDEVATLLKDRHPDLLNEVSDFFQ